MIDQYYNFDFIFMSGSPYYRFKAGDCIQIMFENPYADEAPGTYESFLTGEDPKRQCEVSALK